MKVKDDGWLLKWLVIDVLFALVVNYPIRNQGLGSQSMDLGTDQFFQDSFGLGLMITLTVDDRWEQLIMVENSNSDE